MDLYCRVWYPPWSMQATLRQLLTYFVISQSELVQHASRDVQKINNVARFRQRSVVFPRNTASCDSCSRGTWCKSYDTMHLCWFFGLTEILGRSIRILCCCIMADETNLFYLLHDITKLILTVSLDQHWKIMPECNIAQLRALLQLVRTKSGRLTEQISAGYNKCQTYYKML